MQVLQGLKYIIVEGQWALIQVLHIISYLSWVLIMLDESIANSMLLPKGDLTIHCPTFFIRMMICFNGFALVINIIWIFLIAFNPLNVGIAFGGQDPLK
jgi:uncharacterized membrane protein YccF (DUF307 family)